MDVDFDFFEDGPKGAKENRDFSYQVNGTKGYGSHRSEDESDSEVDSESHEVEPRVKNKTTIKARIPRAVESDDSDLDSGRRAPTPDGKRRDAGRNKRHSTNSSESDEGKSRNHKSGESSKINRPKSGHMKERQKLDTAGSDDSYDTVSCSDADSDVTDVSPLNSPHTPIVRSHNTPTLSERARQSKPPVSPMNSKSSRSRPTSAHSKENQGSSRMEHILQANHDSVDMKLLLEAVLEMERGNAHSYNRSSRSSSKGSAKQYKPSGPAPQPKKNYSFRNDQVRTIDLENQRMMKNIMQCGKKSMPAKAKEKTKVARQQHQQPTITTAALNRKKEQQRIERENQALLRRLQHTRATKPVQRDRLLHDYNQAMIFGYSVAAAHDQTLKSTPKKSPYTPSSLVVPHAASSSSLSQTERAKSAVGASPGKRSRPVSATSSKSTPGRPPNFSPGVAPKPAWESSW